MGGDKSQLSPLPRHSQGPHVALAPGRPSLWRKVLAKLGWCSSRQELVVSPQVGIPAAGIGSEPAAAALSGQETGAGRGYPGEGGRVVSWGRWRSRRCWHPHGISSPGRLWRRRGLPRTAGGPRATWGAGGGVSCGLLPGACSERPSWGTESPGQPPAPRAPAHLSRGAGVPGAAPRKAHLQGLQRAG